MAKYLGETEVKVEDSIFKNYTLADWAMYFIESYGQIDGAHHKLWVLDQVARILKGTPVKVKIAKWDDGKAEHRISVVDETSKAYKEWLAEMEEGGYAYDEGIAP